MCSTRRRKTGSTARQARPGPGRPRSPQPRSTAARARRGPGRPARRAGRACGAEGAGGGSRNASPPPCAAGRWLCNPLPGGPPWARRPRRQPRPPAGPARRREPGRPPPRRAPRPPGPARGGPWPCGPGSADPPSRAGPAPPALPLPAQGGRPTAPAAECRGRKAARVLLPHGSVTASPGRHGRHRHGAHAAAAPPASARDLAGRRRPTAPRTPPPASGRRADG